MLDSKELAYRIRKHAINMVHNAHASHIGGVLSCADVVAVLYSNVVAYDANNPQNPLRDKKSGVLS